MKKILKKAAASALSIAMVSVQATAFVGGAGILSMVSPMTVMAEETVTAYWDFKTMEGKYLISIEKWKNEVGREDMTIYYSQNIRPLSSITVYSTHQEG